MLAQKKPLNEVLSTKKRPDSHYELSKNKVGVIVKYEGPSCFHTYNEQVMCLCLGHILCRELDNNDTLFCATLAWELVSA